MHADPRPLVSIEAVHLALGGITILLRADTLGRPLARVVTNQAGAMGALVMGGVASGVLHDLVTATAELVSVDRIFTPDEVAASRADDRFVLYCDLYEATTPINGALTS